MVPKPHPGTPKIPPKSLPEFPLPPSFPASMSSQNSCSSFATIPEIPVPGNPSDSQTTPQLREFQLLGIQAIPKKCHSSGNSYSWKSKQFPKNTTPRFPDPGNPSHSQKTSQLHEFHLLGIQAIPKKPITTPGIPDPGNPSNSKKATTPGIPDLGNTSNS